VRVMSTTIRVRADVSRLKGWYVRRQDL
jgi:hypothetical protein